MNDFFTRKKIESLTLGEKLKKLRSQYRMSLSEVSKATKIQVKYLEYLEAGEYGKLPAEVYVRGFLKNYARHLGLEEDAFLKLYDKEKNIQANLGQQTIFDSRPRLPLAHSFVVTPRAIVTTTIVFIVVGTFVYLFREFRSFVTEPSLIVNEPVSGASVAESLVTVRGRSDRGAEVFVNDEGVYVNDSGEFAEPVVLRPGVNILTVRARNRFQKERSETVTVEALIATPDSATVTAAKERFLVTVSGRGEGADITVVADGQIVYSGKLGEGTEQAVTAERDVTLTSARAENTWVSFRGEASVPLSLTPGPLTIRYTPEGKEVSP